MKEFRSNNFSLSIFSDNSALYQSLRSKLEIFSEREDILILKDLVRVFTRENLTTDYLSLKLVADNIPSLLFEISPYRIIPKEFLKNQSSSENLISDLACILLIESILLKQNQEEGKRKTKSIKGKVPSQVNKKVLRQLAGAIFQFWKESLISFSLKEEKVPSNIKEEYDSVIRAFIKAKGNKKIEIEYVYEACAGGKSHFISEKEAKEKFGEEIILYGVSEIDPLHFKVLEILSAYVKISFLIPMPPVRLMHKNNAKLNSSKLKELIPDWHILNKFFGDKKIEEIQTTLGIEFPEILPDADLNFYESQEAYREIEFIAREILRLMEEHKDDDAFRLTSIKLVLPAEDVNYSLLVSNVFNRMGIPYSFTKDIRKKKSPYFSAVASILKLSISDFDKETIFSLFYNPCFYPILEEMRISVKPEVWNQIISKMNLTEFLDKQHRKMQGFRESNLMTWESLWSRLNLILIGNTSDDTITLETELMEEVYEFLAVSSSLLQDLIGLKEDFSRLSDFSKFFRIILDTYLHPSMRYNKSEEIVRLNERGLTKINNLLVSIESIDSELDSLLADNLDFTLDDFVDILLTLMESWTEGDARVLKTGVVVGELLDVIDPSFDYVFLMGLDERKFSHSSSKHDSVMIEDTIHSSQLDAALKLKNYFYHIFNHNARRYTFTYVSLDTIKDREYYPARELEWIKSISKQANTSYKKIPLFSYLEYRMDAATVFEKETFNLIDLKQKESNLSLLKNSYPNWIENSDSRLSSEIDTLTSNKNLNQKMKSYFFRSSIDAGHSKTAQNKNLSVSKFVSYMECPKKFFYQYSVDTEEEADVSGELESVSALTRNFNIKELFSYLREDSSLDATSLTKKIFSAKRVESGELPFGVLGKLAELEFKDYLENFFLPFHSELLSENNKIFKKAVFSSEVNKTLDSIVFSTPTIWNESIKANADLLLLERDTLYLTSIVSAKEVKDKNRIKSGLTAFVVNQSEQIKKEIYDLLGVKSVCIAPAILHFPLQSKPSIIRGRTMDYSDDLFLPFWKSLSENQYPAFPIGADKRKCDYCSVKTVCHGYHTEFLSFLEAEMEQIQSVVKDQFA